MIPASVSGWAGLLCIVLVGVNLASLAIAGARLHRRRLPLTPAPGTPPVTIVRPVCGIETFSDETLRSAFALDYPDYEIVFCVADGQDPIVPLARRLIDEHPERAARLLVGDVRISAHPKLNNCVRGWDEARHDWVILADSNVLMPADYIQRMLAAWRPDTGLVCSTPAGSRPRGFWAEVECAFLNGYQARWQFVSEAVGNGFAQGKSMLWHKPFLEARGGIRALAGEIAEDAASTKLVRQAGRHVHLVDAPFDQPIGTRRLRDIWSRQFRWARLRRVTFPLFFAPEIASTAAPAFLAGAVWAWPSAGAIAAALIAVALAWYGPEIWLTRRMAWPLSWRYPLAAFARDALIPAMWSAAWFARDVVWRGNAMSIRSDESELRPAHSSVGGTSE